MLPSDLQAKLDEADPALRAKVQGLLDKLKPAPAARKMSDPLRACPHCGGITYLLSWGNLSRHCSPCSTSFIPV